MDVDRWMPYLIHLHTRAEICQFQVSRCVDQHIIRFDIPVKNGIAHESLLFKAYR